MRRCLGRRGTFRDFAGVVLAGMLFAAAAAQAELVRVEEVGSIGVGSSRGDLRQAAVERGIGRGVLAVASQVAGRGPEGEVGDLRAALGPDLVVYAERFRVLEDRGRGPSQPDGSEGSGGGEVYSVLMEVTVDRDRVERRLEEQGLLVAAPLPSGPADPIGVEVRSIGSYADLEALEAALAAPSFAESVTPRAFERGRASLRVKTYESPAALAARLLESVPPDLDLRGVWVEQETVVVELAPAAD